MWQPQNVETALHGLSLGRLGFALFALRSADPRGPEAGFHAACMVLLAILALILERSSPTLFKEHPTYTFRASGQAGLAQGLLALPSLAISIFIATRSWWWQQAARLFLASSFQVLLWFAWTAAAAAHTAPQHKQLAARPSRGSPSETTQPAGATAPHPTPLPSLSGAASHPQLTQAGPAGGSCPPPPSPSRLFLAATAAGCLLSAASAVLHAAQPPSPSSPHLLLPGSVFVLPPDITASSRALQAALLAATVPSLDRLVALFPRSFTPGEAGIVLQALLALAAGAAAYLAGALRQGVVHALWSPHVVQPDPGMHVPAFCMLVLFWVLLLAACSAVALGGSGGRGSSGGGGEEAVAVSGGRAGARSGLRGPEGGGEGGKRRQQQQRAVGGRWGVAAAVRLVAGLGAVVCLGMLCDLALWVLGRFVAASSRPRLATLAYWFGCLGLAVPLMHVVSKASAAREEQQQGQGQQQGRQEQGQGRGPASGDAKGREQQQQGKWQQGFDAAVEQAPRARRGRGPASENAACGKGQQNGHSSFVGRSEREGVGITAQQQGHEAAREQGTEEGPEEGRPTGTLRRRVRSTLNGSGHSAPAAAHPPPASPAPSRPGPMRPASSRLLRALAVPHIVMRKGYHLLAILLFLPAFGWDVRMLQASLAVAGAVLVAAELLRCLGPAPLRAAIGGFMADFADARDSGPVYVTHFTLLLGIAVPVWLCEPVCGAAAGAIMAGLYGSEAAGGPVVASADVMGSGGAAGGGGGPLAPPPLSPAAARLLPSCRAVLGLSGLVSLGSGDTAAACVGFLLGRRRLFRGGRKTWEGTLSGAAAMLASWAVVVWWVDVRWALSWGVWVQVAAVTGCVALLEAVTQQLDNVVVPLYYLTHLVLPLTGN